jgi:uncharacterized membrane protein YdjX (TVP38/TMEM64 family)
VGESSKLRRRRAGIRVIVFLTVVVVLWALGQTLELEGTLTSIQGWARELGAWAPAAFVGGYILATVLGVPGTPLTVAAALIFGPRDGLLVAIAASTGTAIVAFWLARTVAREPLERWLSKRPAYERLQRLLRRNEWTAIAILRVQPLFPFTLVNYALGLSRVPFWKYLLASEIGMIPMNAVWVFSATSVYRIVLQGEVPWALLGITLGAAVVLALLAYFGRKLVDAVNGNGRSRAQAAQAEA